MNNIFLSGFMGAGKTAIGKELAGLINYDFVDLDEQIEQNCGMPISQIFYQDGEAYFRKLERDAVSRCLDSQNLIVALGGGALQNERLTNKIKEQGLLVFIECDFSVILKRLKGDKSRPLLLNADGSPKEPELLERELTELYKKRLPLYKLAAITIKSSEFPSARRAAVYLRDEISHYNERY